MKAPLVPPEGSGFEFHDLLILDHSDEPTADLLSLFYPNAVHSFIGEPATGKTWAALAVATEVLRDGKRVIFLDFEDTARTAMSRLRALGLDPGALANLTYCNVLQHPDESDMAWAVRIVEEHKVALVLIDSVPEAMALAGLDENVAGDVTRWFQAIPRPLARAGATVLLVDHVVKTKEGRDRWARGSGAKLSAIDGAAYLFEIVEGFSRQRPGLATLRVSKDRHGAVGGTRQPVRSVCFDVAGGSLDAIRFEPYREPITSGDGSGEASRSRHIDPEDVRAALGACGGVWWSRKDAAEALGVSGHAVANILADAVGVGAISVEHPGSGQYRYSLPDTSRAEEIVQKSFPGAELPSEEESI